MGSTDATTKFLSGDAETLRSVRAAIGHELGKSGLDSVAREEIAQESIARLVANLMRNRFRGEASLETYARKIARYTRLEMQRRIRESTGLEADVLKTDERNNPEKSLLVGEDRDRRLRALAELPAMCRKLFLLIFVERVSYDATAEHFDVSATTIRTRVHRCREKLRLALGKVMRGGAE